MVTKINISSSAALFSMKNLEGKKNNYKQCASIDSIQYHSWLTVGSQVTWIFCKFFYYISTYTFTFCVRHDIKSSYFSRFLLTSCVNYVSLIFSHVVGEVMSAYIDFLCFVFVYFLKVFAMNTEALLNKYIYIYIYIKLMRTWIVIDLVKNTKQISIKL